MNSLKVVFLLWAFTVNVYGALEPCESECVRVGDAARPAVSCWDVVARRPHRPPASGYYWLTDGTMNNGSAMIYRVYCDMTTAGGGWTLIARVTDDYSWACGDRDGQNCQSSSAPPSHGNLWHSVHSRLSVKPEFITKSADSGVHLPLSFVQHILSVGQNSVRFSFYKGRNLLEHPADDAIAQFEAQYNLFSPTSSAKLDKNTNYTFHVLRHTNPYSTTFRGSRICWLNSDATKRGYEGGLFMGDDDQHGGTYPCHMNNDNAAVQLKSHLVSSSGSAWYRGQHGLLKKGALQVSHDALMLWVR